MVNSCQFIGGSRHQGNDVRDTMIKKIMIATDGSDTSKKAAIIGIDIAHRANGSITAVYVMEILRLAHLPGYATLPGLKEKILELMQEEGKQATQFVEDQAQMMKVSCQKIVAQGSPMWSAGPPPDRSRRADRAAGLVGSRSGPARFPPAGCRDRRSRPSCDANNARGWVRPPAGRRPRSGPDRPDRRWFPAVWAV